LRATIQCLRSSDGFLLSFLPLPPSLPPPPPSPLSLAPLPLARCGDQDHRHVGGRAGRGSEEEEGVEGRRDGGWREGGREGGREGDALTLFLLVTSGGRFFLSDFALGYSVAASYIHAHT
ncbi:hypothetical protein Naga_101163g2, partial [Nannochloropsis gaditana]